MLLLSRMLVVLSILVMAGCGPHRYVQRTDIAEYPYRYGDFDYKYAWKTTATDHGTLISGVMKNVRYAYIDSVVMKIALLNKDGKTVAYAVDFPSPQQSREGDVSNFGILLENAKPVLGDILQFEIQYAGNEGGNHSGVNWHSIFKTDALSGTAIRQTNINADQW